MPWDECVCGVRTDSYLQYFLGQARPHRAANKNVTHRPVYYHLGACFHPACIHSRPRRASSLSPASCHLLQVLLFLALVVTPFTHCYFLNVLSRQHVLSPPSRVVTPSTCSHPLHVLSRHLRVLTPFTCCHAIYVLSPPSLSLNKILCFQT